MMIINVLTALLTPTIAIVTAYIAYQQYVLNKRNSEYQNNLNQSRLETEQRKLKMELFEKRYRIYEETKSLLLKITKTANFSLVESRDFCLRTNECRFLFDSEITDFLEELTNKALEYSNAMKESKKYDGIPMPTTQNKYISKLAEWFTSEYKHIHLRFDKYLDIKKV